MDEVLGSSQDLAMFQINRENNKQILEENDQQLEDNKKIKIIIMAVVVYRLGSSRPVTSAKRNVSSSPPFFDQMNTCPQSLPLTTYSLRGPKKDTPFQYKKTVIILH